MGKTKKRYNWKSRQVVKTEIDKSEEKKIEVDIPSVGRYDEANPLVIPSKKRQTKLEIPKTQVKRLLSKKKRKELEKIVERKKKKENRAALLESLAKVQAKPEELSKMVSISTAITKGLKRRYRDDDPFDSEGVDKVVSASGKNDSQQPINSIKGARKRRRLLEVINNFDKKKKIHDPNIVGFTESSSEDSSDDNDEASESIKQEILDDDKNENPESVNETVTVNVEEISKSTEEKQDDAKQNTNDKLLQNVNGGAKVEVNKKISVASIPAVYVPVDRKPEIQEARLKLPILAEEQIIMENINENPVILIAGETGSGKTTQVPQFLYEAGYARDGKIIGITEPRRVAAISMAKRVGEELNLNSDEVSYLIRFEGNVTPNTKIKFMTDGVLLKEVQSDFLLNKYSVIILDEAHERSVYTDILMGLLSRIVVLRNKRGIPLKLIIMSATLKVEDFTENTRLFKVPPPVIKVESRQFPVTVHFNKRTNPDYLKEAYRKTCKIHTQLPDGGILIFLTGQQEVNTLVSKLRKAFPYRKITKKSVATEQSTEEKEKEDEEDELNLDRVIQKVKKKKKETPVSLPEINLDNYDVAPNDDTEMDILASDEEADEEDWELEGQKVSNAQPLWVLPLYSVLPSREQAKVFQEPPEGCRLCVVATNVAETSLTIPGVKYVVDSGKVKAKLYDKITGVSGFSITWASKAAADQRAGRAGRTSPGHCYRLYSSAVFNDEFEGWTVPEMQRRPVDELVLQMKSLGIQRVVNFPFPSSPDLAQLKSAEQRLTYLGALEKTTKKRGEDGWIGRLTPLGEAMAKFPVAPRFAKMLCLSHQHNLMEYTITLVAALSIQELLLNDNESQNKVRNHRLSWAGQGNSKLLGDAMVLLRSVGAAEYANSCGKLEEFCNEHRIRLKGIIEARKIRIQLTNEINLLNPELNLPVNPKLKPPTDTQARLLRQIVLSGMLDQVARKVDEPQESTVKQRPLYHTPLLEETVQVHSSSVLYKEYPEWIVYQEIYQTNKVYLRGITAVEPEWLPVFAKSLCRLGVPLEDPEPRYDPTTGLIYCHVKGTFGRRGWELPAVEIEFPPVLDKYKWFAKFLLEGSIFPKLKKFTKSLLSTPKTMIRSWARLQPRTEILLKTLIQKEVNSRDKLLNVWKTEPTYLLEAYQKWLPETAHNETSVIWPPID
ncbi:probable ATP-dependent RNA helicase kurz [Halyomorpha halys]|uniref:probable ATP-dependent RNA helicase kurz n=1 Tax=Halyomorpha halys TaxID=286706 RepID=UPI0006D527CB|nr:probable ATP-dependent RNA helicase kurz [Halyomorpha halys]